MIKSIFWNEDEHRVRALWRQILQVALWFILWQGLSILAAKLIGPFIHSRGATWACALDGRRVWHRWRSAGYAGFPARSAARAALCPPSLWQNPHLYTAH
jgi:hypothetical protein